MTVDSSPPPAPAPPRAIIPPNNVRIYLAGMIVALLGGLAAAILRPADILAIFAFVAPVILLLGVMLQNAQQSAIVVATNAAVQQIVPVVATTHNLVNGQHEELLALAKAAARAEGLAEGLAAGAATEVSRVQAVAVSDAISAAAGKVSADAVARAADIAAARAEGLAEGLAAGAATAQVVPPGTPAQ